MASTVADHADGADLINHGPGLAGVGTTGHKAHKFPAHLLKKVFDVPRELQDVVLLHSIGHCSSPAMGFRWGKGSRLSSGAGPSCAK